MLLQTYLSWGRGMFVVTVWEMNWSQHADQGSVPFSEKTWLWSQSFFSAVEQVYLSYPSDIGVEELVLSLILIFCLHSLFVLIQLLRWCDTPYLCLSPGFIWGVCFTCTPFNPSLFSVTLLAPHSISTPAVCDHIRGLGVYSRCCVFADHLVALWYLKSNSVKFDWVFSFFCGFNKRAKN